MKKLLGIDEDYYVAVPPDPTDEEMEVHLGHFAGTDSRRFMMGIATHARTASGACDCDSTSQTP